MNYIITMQYLENYGLHNDEPSHYWKPKGGEIYHIYGAPDREATVVACLNIVRANTNRTGYQFYIRSVERSNSWDAPEGLDEDMFHEWDWKDLEAEANKAFKEKRDNAEAWA